MNHLVSGELAVLVITAASVGFIHTLTGPDHYIPFVAMAKARSWSTLRTVVITLLCGAGHILSSVVLGLVGVACGIGVMKLEALEGMRGNIAGWLLVCFGFAYFVWGVRRAFKKKIHSHGHVHSPSSGPLGESGLPPSPRLRRTRRRSPADLALLAGCPAALVELPVRLGLGGQACCGELHDDPMPHAHEHSHLGNHTHVHDEQMGRITPWILFTIFLFGPCEPLIPIVMYPAAKHNFAGLVLVTGVFGAVTILTMLGVVLASLWGMSVVRIGKTEHYAHALAGASILACGIAVQFLGL